MSNTVLKLTPEQMDMIAKEMSLVDDEIVLSVNDSEVDFDNSFVAMSKTYTIS